MKEPAEVDCLGSFWTRLRDSSTPIVQKRFIESIIGYAAGASKQTGIRERRMTSSVEEYIALRRETSAVKVFKKMSQVQDSLLTKDSLKTCFPLIEYMLEIEVPDIAWRHPVIESLHEAANDIIAWGNVSRFLSEAFFYESC